MQTLSFSFAVCCVCLFSCSSPVKVPAGIELIHRTGLASTHLASCDDPACGDGQNPPLGGPHCAQTLACRVYDSAQPRCSWVHNLEHGHLVLAYNCAGGCPEVVAALTAIREAQAKQGNTRVIITPDAQLPGKVAAVVWGWGWVGDEANADAIGAVLAHQDDEAPESELSCAP